MNYNTTRETVRKYYEYKNWEQPILSSNGVMGGDSFACNQSSYLGTDRLAWKAFNADNTTYADSWHSAKGHPAWIEWYNPKPLLISSIQVRNRDSDGSFIKSYTVSYSDDGTTYTSCKTGTSPNQTAYALWSISIDEANPHKYWRLTCNTSSGQNNGYTAIQSILINAQELFQDYKDVEVYKAVKELVRKYYKYKTSANGYRQLTYIQSDGNQYIDLGISLGSATMEVNLDVQYISVNRSYFVGAGYDLSSAGRGVGFGVRDSKYLVIEPGSNWNQFGTVTTDRTQFKWVINGNTSTLTGYASNTVTSSSHFGTSCAWRNYNLTLFKSPNDSPISCKMYSSDLLINDIKVRNLIPHERLFDNAIGLYDTENDVFYTNSGSGSFIKGDYIIEESTSSDYDFYKDVDVYKVVREADIESGNIDDGL